MWTGFGSDEHSGYDFSGTGRPGGLAAGRFSGGNRPFVRLCRFGVDDSRTAKTAPMVFLRQSHLGLRRGFGVREHPLGTAGEAAALGN